MITCRPSASAFQVRITMKMLNLLSQVQHCLVEVHFPCMCFLPVKGKSPFNDHQGGPEHTSLMFSVESKERK